MPIRACLLLFALPLGLVGLCGGCGTTKWTDTSRSATEQLLLTDSIDRAVSDLDLRSIAGKRVYLDDAAVRQLSDAPYLVSAVRQHILASGGILRQHRDEADYVLELRAGAVGTDRHDLLFGMPAVTFAVPGSPAPSQIPEIPLVKRTDQRGVAKIAMFAYNRQTGRPIWQSGVASEESKAKAVWFFGAGPFQRGHIYEGTKFAGSRLSIPLIDLEQSAEEKADVSIADQVFFVEPRPPDGAAGPLGLQVAGYEDRLPAEKVSPRAAPAPQADDRPPGEFSPATTPPPGGPPPSTSTTTSGLGTTVPPINLPGQLPFGMPVPWAPQPTSGPAAESQLGASPPLHR